MKAWAGSGIAVAAAVLASVSAQAATPITIEVFSAPSLGAFLPAVIKAEKLDAANGLDISFPARTPDAYAAQFNADDFDLGGSASVLTVGLAEVRGVKAAYLFNLFDYWGAVVTQRPGIQTLADLKGKQLAAAKGTTNYEMFEWFAEQQGLQPASLQVVNTATPGLIGYALADRADAVQLWEPAYSILMAKKPDMRTLDLHIAKEWQSFGGGAHIPYLGVAAHTDWIAKHPDLIAPLYRTYRAAAQWVTAHPADAAPIVAGGKADAQVRQAIEQLIRNNARLGMNVAGAAQLKDGIHAVYRAGMAIKLLSKMPSDATIYDKALD